MNINKVMVAGRLTKKPEMKSLPSGIAVASFSLAVNSSYKDKNGERQEKTEFVNVVVFGKQAETCTQYLEQGQIAFVEGRLQTRSWDGQDGKKNYRTEVVADRVQFGERSRGATAKKVDESAQAPAKNDVATIEYPDEDINPDDIPF